MMRGMGSGITVKVNKETLKGILKENRERHIESHRLALEGYVDAVKAELEGKLARLAEGKKVDAYSKHVEPQSHLEDYDEVIGMLELATDVELELDQGQYRQYVTDDWNWKDSWNTSNSGYVIAAAAKH